MRKDEDDNVIGIYGAAFRLRENEEYLSATWAEFFQGATHDDRIVATVRAIRASNLDVRPKSGFAVGRVDGIKRACLDDPKKHKIRFIHEAEPDNPGHAALRGWPKDNDDLLNMLAEEVWCDAVLNVDIPA
ncbi:hypothetical protein XH89_20060 [Bradyrhizobium sp. CCBAU 53340]|uniref:hypothetical protein n=1 Tax=Bradyrhizobium sp. CCBAU 53340 TaxID=1325112 RepID=UPI00188B90C7|nr:hypothetical protein [Bradyrhizobium sp. CCBAU 53340]QOZ45522.1 hypothetical protein XH89_20060 [Bradyrhizobium sp. CCBAU 53340]